MKELKFFVCTHCGNLAGMVYNSGVPMICCGEPMKELVPNTVDAAGEGSPDPVGGPADRAGRPAQGAGRRRRAQGCLCPGRRRQGRGRLRLLQPPRPVEDRAVSQPAEVRPKNHRSARASGRFFVGLSQTARIFSPLRRLRRHLPRTRGRLPSQSRRPCGRLASSPGGRPCGRLASSPGGRAKFTPVNKGKLCGKMNFFAALPYHKLFRD